jgi:hypothetical protein
MVTEARARGLAGCAPARAWLQHIPAQGRRSQDAVRLHPNGGAQREREHALCERATRNSNRLRRN